MPTMPKNGFHWVDRNACVEALAMSCYEQELKYETAIKKVLMHIYCNDSDKMSRKQQANLKKDVIKRAKDIQLERKAPEVGDVVKVNKLVPNPLLGGYKHDGKQLVEAIVVDVRRYSSGFQIKVQRIQDGEIQSGNGHMIKSIVKKAAESLACVSNS